MRAAAFLAALPAATLLGGAVMPMPFTVAETGRSYARLSEAVAATDDRTATISIAPGTYRQCTVQRAGRITYRAKEPGTVIFDGVACEGKAALVLRGQAARVEGVTFSNLHVPDGNGAGIRLERGSLVVTHSTFRDSEEGILASSDPAASITIDRSTFVRLGRCDRGLDCAHSIYVGHYRQLTITNSRFLAGTGGHYVKSRASRVTIAGNTFDDRGGHATNYMIDLPNGSSGIIGGNRMVQGRDKDNHSAFIAIGPEGREHDSSTLRIENNMAGFEQGVLRTSTFVANWTRDHPRLSGNRLASGIRPTDQR